MKFNFDEKASELIKILIFSGTILMLIFYGITKLDYFFAAIGDFLTIILPFIFGFSFAFLMMPIYNKIKAQWLVKTKLKEKTKSKIAAFLSIGFLLFIVGLVMAIIVPQVYVSVLRLSQNGNEYLNNIDDVLNGASKNPFIQELVNIIWIYSEDLFTGLVGALKDSLPQILDYSISIVKTTINIFIGVFIAVYIMIDKARFVRQAKKAAYAFFPKKSVDYVAKIGKLTTEMFNAFIVGKTVDSLIIGAICFVGMLIMGMEYALLISVIIGVTNMIPVFGPFIGAVPGFLILFIFNPTQALLFLIWILILQQFDGNILGPYILGDSVGLPSFWVMFAIIIGGGLFGIIGMFLGVPFFAVIYITIKNIIEDRLERKKIKIE